MEIKMVDVTVHIDEETDHETRELMKDQLRGMEGVMAAITHDERPHLMVVEYDPDRINSAQILAQVKDAGVHAELIGL